jgi:hypothetical protein
MATPTATVRRNTKRFAAIFAQATRGAYSSLSNEFCATDAPIEHIRGLAAEVIRRDAKVRDNRDGTFTVSFHSNEWVDIHSPA